MQSDPSGTLAVQKWMTISLIRALQVTQSQKVTLLARDSWIHSPLRAGWDEPGCQKWETDLLAMCKTVSWPNRGTLWTPSRRGQCFLHLLAWHPTTRLAAKMATEKRKLELRWRRNQIPSRTFDEGGGQPQLPKLWFNRVAMCKRQRTFLQLHRFRGNVARPSIVSHSVAIEEPETKTIVWN